MRNFILAFLGVILLSCSRPPTKPEPIEPETELQIEEVSEKELSRLEKRRKIEEAERLDSIRLEGVLSLALLKIKPYSLKTSFNESYQFFADSLYKVDVQIDYDFHFSDKKRHLIIRSFSPGLVQFDVFVDTNKGLIKTLSHKQWELEYTGDTLADINGDGLKDLVVNWYGRTGCCLKAFSSVYLIRNDLLSFSNMNEFINPTFSSRERIIRGICYGHPGETELYKFKWNGEKIDTIEYIAFEVDNNRKRTGKVIISNQYPGHKDYQVNRMIDSVPIEYNRIDGFGWFALERLYP